MHAISSNAAMTSSASTRPRFFRDDTGATALVRSHRYAHADYLVAFAAAGLELRRCIEPGFGRGEVALQQPAAALIPEATETAFPGLPAALIWHLTARPGVS
jgi:hypothetical protein